jgi:hypothetical protein
MKNPWDHIPPATRGDRTATPIFTAVGQIMSAWEFIEFDLSEMFEIFTGGRASSKGMSPALRAYGTIINFRSRKEMLSAAAKVFFKANPRTRLERPFKSALKKCNGWADRRNEVAHGIVLKLSGAKGYLLYPSPYNSRKYPIDQPKAIFQYRASQIRKFTTALAKLRRQTRNLVTRLDAETERRRQLRRQVLEHIQQRQWQRSHQSQGQNDQRLPLLPPQSSGE